MKRMLAGTGVAIATPFHDSGTVDFGSFEKMIEHVIVNEVDYIVALGTTGEAATLSADEQLAVIDFVVDIAARRVPVVLGMGGNNTQNIINCIKSTDFSEISAILSVCPYYNKPQQSGIYDHYREISSACPVPVILYNVPGRTSCNITAQTALRLACDFSNIAGIKEASGDLGQIMEIISNRPDGFLVISGDDALTLPIIASGGDGVISVAANVYPRAYSQMVKLALKGKFEKARKIHYSLLHLIDLLFKDGSPAGVKAALENLELCGNYLRLPLARVNDEVYEEIRQEIEKLNDDPDVKNKE